MFVSLVSLQRRRGALAVDIVEPAEALDDFGIGNIIFATLVDDPADVTDAVDAFTGELLYEAASATDTVGTGSIYVAAIDEGVTAVSALDVQVPAVVAADVAEPAGADTALDASYGAWTPADLATLKGWYQADLLAGSDGSAVSSWPDSSGLGNNATPTNGPTLQTAEQNGKNVVQFVRGSSQYFSLANLLSGASAAAAVFVAKAGSISAGSPVMTGSDNAGNNYPYLFDIIEDSFASTARKSFSISSFGGGAALQAWHLGSFHSQASDWRYFFNGVQQYSTSTNTVGLNTTPRIGTGRYDVSGYFWDGMIGEIVIVNEFLSTLDRQKVEGYLAHKWGLAGSLDSGHPYKSAPP